MAALLIAGDGAGPTVLGSDRIAFHLRRARAVGVAHAVIFAERVTSPLLATVDRLRGEGMSVDIARNVGDAAELIHPDEPVLMIAPDLIVTPERLEQVADSHEFALLCVRDEPANEQYELIDPTARWTGYARIDGGLLRRTAAMVGDWDFSSTLMRRAVQEGAARITLTADEAGAELIRVDGATASQIAGRRLVASLAVERAGWATQWILGPLARVAARVAGDLRIEAGWVTLAGFATFAVAVICALAGWVVASLILLLAGMILDYAGNIGMRAGAGTQRWEQYRFPVRAALAAAVAIATGVTLTLRTAQWGCIVLSLVVIGATLLAAPILRDDERMAAWRSDPGGHTMLMLIGFALGSPILALVTCAVHAAVSLGWAVRKQGAGLARS